MATSTKQRLRILLAILLPALLFLSFPSGSVGSDVDGARQGWTYRPLARLVGADGGDYADFNGDGVRDMCVAAEEGRKAVCYLLDGTGATVTAAIEVGIFSPPGPEDVAVGDLTGDGRADLAYFRQGSNQVGFIHCGDNLDASTCQKVSLTGVTHPVHNGFITDVDQDGNQDVVYAASKWGSSTIPGAEVAWFENPFPTDPTKSSNWIKHIIAKDDSEFRSAWGFPGTGEYNQIGFVDLFKNGTRYLIVSERLANQISVYTAGDPTTQWDQVTMWVEGTDESSPKHMTAQDVDADGDVDLAITLQQGGILLWENVGSPGALAFHQHEIDRVDDRGLGISPMGIGFHDLDNDGKFELVVNEYGNVAQTYMYIYEMKTISNWMRGMTIYLTYAGDDLFFDDINHDGAKDILSTWASVNDGSVYALLQKKSYKFKSWIPVFTKG